MVVIDQNPDVKENPENAEPENSDEKTDKEDLTAKLDTPPTELERLKSFTQKVARCAAKSFCETYVRPLVIKNPNTLPPSITVDVTNQKIDENAIVLNPGEKTEDQADIVLKPQEEEEDRSPLINSRQERLKESERQVAAVNPNKHYVTNFKEEELITIDRQKPGFTFDIVNILSYIVPCQSLIAASDEESEKEGVPMNMDSLVEETMPCGPTCKCSKSNTTDKRAENDDEDSPLQ